ncbi:Putative binding domain-containing protein, N-terminal [Andreprevotia lacus DSM 23236]|jgi:hypothetical protein|uniref:Putative binding domain-containing protein, N-terminal n=1 Tax=Andreprevotia lacus DSM 23236 TaxID=1121001 RepID=A0A1W1WZ18_9NEIS|nr:kelch repeat-containing protein [Andreprevotia lacus]SMC16976.1 Putative binding domain-containing protein, N-terminal [Andreprevotia lacus DSM 23236]
MRLLGALVLSCWLPLALASAMVGNMQTPRSSQTATLLADGSVLVAGGDTASGSLSSMTATAERYAPATYTFSPTGSLQTARSGHAAIRLNDGRVLVLGGLGYINGQSVTLKSAELYDPATGSWTPTGSMLTARRSPVVLLLSSGKVLVVGGGSSIQSTEIYDPATGSFAASGSLQTARDQFAATVLADDRVLVAGGALGIGGTTASAELWTPGSGTWAYTGSMLSARAYASATLLKSGKVLIAGGNASSTFPSGTELFDPVSNTFSAGPVMQTPRSTHQASLLADGSVLVTGGWNSSYVTQTSAELYNPQSNSWQQTGTTSSRNWGIATVLGTGDAILITGSSSSSLAATAEWFSPACGLISNATNPASLLFPQSGGPGSFTVTLPANCLWSVNRPSGWLSITGSGMGSGNGIVTFNVASFTPPPNQIGRGATLFVNESAVSINQNLGTNTAAMTPASQAFTAAGGSGNISVSVPAGTNWSVTNIPAWISTSQTAGNGSATLSFTVAPNSGDARIAWLQIAGLSFTVTQAAAAPSCTPTLSSNSASFGPATVSGNVALTVASGCTWSVTGVPAWVTVSPLAGSGGAQISFTLASNSGAARSATLAIAGQNYTVSQAAASACSQPLLSTSTQNFAAAGGPGSVNVSATAGCSWTATGLPDWLTPTGSASGNGNGVFNYTVAPNTNSASPRVATLQIGGSNYTVSQPAGLSVGCVGSTSGAAPATANSQGDTQSIFIYASNSCSWTVGALPGWITLTSPASNVGQISLKYSVAPNDGPARSAILAAAGLNITINQAASSQPAACLPVEIRPGIAQSGSLSYSSCTAGARGSSYFTNRHSFYATAGQAISIQLNGGFDTYLYLKDPNGIVIASNDDDIGSGLNGNSRIPPGAGSFTLPASISGTYVIEVTSYLQRIIGNYSLKLNTY